MGKQNLNELDPLDPLYDWLQKLESDKEYQKRREESEKKATSVEGWFSDPEGGYEGIKEKIDQGELPPMEQWFWDEESCAPSFRDEEGEQHGLDEIWMFHYDMEPYNELGYYGSMRLKYLRETPSQSGTFFVLLTYGKLFDHCREIEDAALEREETMVREQMKPYKELQNTDFLRYVQLRNNITAGVQEVLREEILS